MKFIAKFALFVVKVFAALVVIVMIIAASTMFFSRQEKQITRTFFELVAEQKFEEAHALFAPAFKSEYPLDRMKAEFGSVSAYTKQQFMHIKSSTNEGTILAGKATTADGCVSDFEFRYRDEKIVFFGINPPCLSAELST